MYFKRATLNVPEGLKLSVLQVMFDMLMVHEHVLLQQQGENSPKITELLVTRLTEETSPKVKALLAIGISKTVTDTLYSTNQTKWEYARYSSKHLELSTLRHRLDDEEVISATQVATLFVDWTDPLKLAQAINAITKGKADETIQVHLTSDITKQEQL